MFGQDSELSYCVLLHPDTSSVWYGHSSICIKHEDLSCESANASFALRELQSIPLPACLQGQEDTSPPGFSSQVCFPPPLFLSSSLSSFLTRVCREHRPFFPPSPFLQFHRSVSTWPLSRPRRFINRHHHRKAATLISHATTHRATTTSERLQHTNRDPSFLHSKLHLRAMQREEKSAGRSMSLSLGKGGEKVSAVTSWRKLYK